VSGLLRRIQGLQEILDGGDEGTEAASTTRSAARQIVDVQELKPDRYANGISYAAGDPAILHVLLADNRVELESKPSSSHRILYIYKERPDC